MITIPKYAMIIKGTWLEDVFEHDKTGYGHVWCEILTIDIVRNQMQLKHPKYGEFAWVNIDDCRFSKYKAIKSSN